MVYDCFLKLNWKSFVHQFQLNFLPHLNIVPQNEVDWFSALALVNWQFQEQFWRSRWWAFWENVVSLLPGIHSAWQSFYTNIFVQSVIFCDFLANHDLMYSTSCWSFFLPISHLAQVWYSRPSYIKLQKLWSNIYVRSLE